MVGTREKIAVVISRPFFAFLCYLLLLGPIFPLVSDEVEDYLERVEDEIENESYTRAISLLEEGKKKWPGDYRLSRQAADLYLNRELYRLALSEYERAAVLAPEIDEIQWKMAQAMGYLGKNDEAVFTLEQLLERLPKGGDDNLEGRSLRETTLDDLSWMYFKVNRFDDGIALLEEELEDSFDPWWAHTLGTLYSGKYNLEESRKWYQLSIDEALAGGEYLFASIACYNMALLEFSFYSYDEARKRALQSLELRDRSGGHLVVGELDFMAWNLIDALDSYRLAESRDDTPLARMDLAEFYLRTGYPDQALRFLDQAEGSGDESWMYRYGLDSTRFGMDLAENRRDALSAKAEIDALTPRAGWKNRAVGFWNRLGWKAGSLYQNRRYRALANQYVEELREKGNELDAAWYAFKAHSGYRRQALKHLEEARRLETSFAPEAENWYLMETGIQRRSVPMLAAALNGFLPEEGKAAERALRELSLAGNQRRPGPEKLAAMARLYAVNPGGLRAWGLSLPVAIVSSGDSPRGILRRTRRMLKRSGYVLVDAGDAVAGTSVLRINTRGDGRIQWFLEDPDGRSRASAESGTISRKEELAEVLTLLLNGFYTTPLPEVQNEAAF